jgi:hypothetical protein
LKNNPSCYPSPWVDPLPASCAGHMEVSRRCATSQVPSHASGGVIGMLWLCSGKQGHVCDFGAA